MKKVCYACGMDLTGRTRFKDSLGYWCKHCHRADELRRKGVTCSSCGRDFPESKLIEFDGVLRCATCEKERQREVFRKLNEAAKERRYWKAEWHQVKWLAVVAVVLLAIILLARSRVLL
jgi:DNA-directed RNA polymerase subunit RPC12/RpoP